MRLFAPNRPPYATLPFFAGWSEPELTRFSRLVEVIDYEPGDVLAAGGRRAQEFVLIVVGRVDLIDGSRRVCTLGEGDSIAAEALLTGSVPTATAVAQTYVQALVLGSRQFHGLLYDVPSMGLRLAHLFAARLAATA